MTQHQTAVTRQEITWQLHQCCRAVARRLRQLLEETFGAQSAGRVRLKGTVVGIEKDLAVIDVGLKTEGRVALRIPGPGSGNENQHGDTVEVYLERVENALGEAVLSRDKARRERAGQLESASRTTKKFKASPSIRLKAASPSISTGSGSFPRSQVDIPRSAMYSRDERDAAIPDSENGSRRGNIVVSRRTVLEETRAEQRQELVQTPRKRQSSTRGQEYHRLRCVRGPGGIDGLLHVTDIAWRPSIIQRSAQHRPAGSR